MGQDGSSELNFDRGEITFSGNESSLVLQYSYRRDRIITRAGGEIYSPAPMSCKNSTTVQLEWAIESL